MPFLHFIVFIAVSLLLFAALLRFALRGRARPPSLALVAGLAFTAEVGGTLFATFGAGAGWHWGWYFGVPAVATFVLPPLVLGMSLREAAVFVVLALLASPLIHVVFSTLFGWHEYMPFWRVPSLVD